MIDSEANRIVFWHRAIVDAQGHLRAGALCHVASGITTLQKQGRDLGCVDVWLAGHGSSIALAGKAVDPGPLYWNGFGYPLVILGPPPSAYDGVNATLGHVNEPISQSCPEVSVTPEKDAIGSS